MASRANGQLNLPPVELENCSPEATVRTKSSRTDASRTNDSPDPASIAASELFDAALKSASLSSADAAHLIGVSESLINRMRSPNYREGVSFVQMMRLPASFHIELHRAMNKRFGFGRAALNRLTDAMADLALVVEA